MSDKYIHHSEYFYGHKISEYGQEHGYIDYRTLAASFDAVMCNDIIVKTQMGELGEWEPINGSEIYYTNGTEELSPEAWEELPEEEQEQYSEECREVFQQYIISDAGARILCECTDELVWYNADLDMNVWGVTHWGTSWDYVLTDIRIQLDKEV